MPLDQRTYVCPECGQTIDRDLNAAINIRNFALRNILKTTDGETIGYTNGTSGINTCGDRSSGKKATKSSCETAAGEARKSKHYKKCKKETQKITPFNV